MTNIAPSANTTQPSGVLDEIAAEHARQAQQRGNRPSPRGTGPDGTLMGHPFAAYRDAMRSVTDDLHQHGGAAWLPILLRGAFEAASETDPGKLRAELVKVAATAVAWIEALDRRNAAQLVDIPPGLAQLLAAVTEQLPQDDPEKCARTLADMNRRAAEHNTHPQ